MQALLSYAKKLEPLPDRYSAIDRTNFTIPECQTRVDIFPEYRDGKLHFYADVNVRQSPTIAAFLSILFTAINGQPPATTLAIPSDFVRIDDGEHRPRRTRDRALGNGHPREAIRGGGGALRGLTQPTPYP